MTGSVSITGGCLCGAIRYRFTAPPLLTRYCWCRVCQYLGAGNATVNICFPTDAFTLEGSPVDYRSLAESGNVMHRRFCPRCGTQVFSAADQRPHLVIVRNGALDDTALLKPSATIWVKEAPEWAWIDETQPQHPGQPPPVA